MLTPDSNSKFDDYIIPAGSYAARLYLLVDLGHQYVKFMEKPGKWSHKIRLGWEIPELTFEAEDRATGKDVMKPRVIGREYTLSYYKDSHLKTDIQSWIGRSLTVDEQDKGFAVDSLLGAPCMISVVHVAGHDKEGKPRTYANLASVMACPRSITVPELYNPIVLYDMDNDPGNRVFEALYPWLQDRIKKAQEFQHEDGDMEAEVPDLSDTSVPFEFDAPAEPATPPETYVYGPKSYSRSEWLDSLHQASALYGLVEPMDMDKMTHDDLQAVGKVLIKQMQDVCAANKKKAAAEKMVK